MFDNQHVGGIDSKNGFLPFVPEGHLDNGFFKLIGFVVNVV